MKSWARHRCLEAVVTYKCSGTAGGQNEYVWQAWATMEARCGNVRLARKVGGDCTDLLDTAFTLCPSPYMANKFDGSPYVHLIGNDWDILLLPSSAVPMF